MRRFGISNQTRNAVAERAHYRCEYCLSPESHASQPFAIDHIFPISAGGDESSDNLAYACDGCNGHKHAKTQALDPVTKDKVALFHPRNQNWSDHFKWNEEFTLVLGLTATGRATINALRMNRAGVVRLREALYELGLHPPAEE